MPVLLAGGGTLGHVVPGIAVADAIQRLAGPQPILFVGRVTAACRDVLLAAGYRWVNVPAAPFAKSPGGLCRFAVGQCSAYLAARRLVSRWRPRLVVGLGGYSSVPLGLAARRAGVPLVLLEQNALPGRANRFLGGRAGLICGGYAEAGRWFDPRRFQWTGNPLRRPPSFTRAAEIADRKVLVVLGGTHGSADLNRQVPNAVARAGLHEWLVLHQTGPHGEAETRLLYLALGLRAIVAPRLPNLASWLGAAGMVICRGGGSTLAELAAWGIPAIVCPFPQAADDHQHYNALALANRGACIEVRTGPAERMWDTRLASELESLSGDTARRIRISEELTRMARPFAADNVARQAWDLAEVQSGSNSPTVARIHA